MQEVTFLIVNYSKSPYNPKGEKTVRLLKQIKEFYPGYPIVVIDDNSPEGYEEVAKEWTVIENPLWKKRPKEMTIKCRDSVFHGLAVDEGLNFVTTKYALCVDQDIILKKPGLARTMSRYAREEKRVVAVGAYWNGSKQFEYPIFPMRLSLWDADFVKDYHLTMQAFYDPVEKREWPAGAFAQARINYLRHETRIISRYVIKELCRHDHYRA